MPRSAWVAAGAAFAAWGLWQASGPAGPLLAAGLALGALTVVVLASRRGARPVRPQRDHRRSRAVAGLATGVLLIALRVLLGLLLAPAAGARTDAEAIGWEGPWTAAVVAVGSPLDGQQRVTLQLDLPRPSRVAATLPRYPELTPGDRVRVDGRIRPPADDAYGQYLVRVGLVGTLRSSNLEVVGQLDGPGWALERLRRTSGRALARAVPEPEAGLAAGILVGLRDLVDADLAAGFTTAGVSHVVAISGWNIAIVGALVAALAGHLARRRRALLTIGAIAAYVAFAGGSASVLRAALMAGVVLLARESGRAGRAAPALGWAATLLLVVDPVVVFDPGFQLSTVATAGLLAWAEPLTRRLAGDRPGRSRRLLAESLGISLAAQAATLPIVLATFGRLSLVAPLVNLLVVPLVAPAMAVGAVALVAGWLGLAGLPAAIVVVAGLPAWLVLGLMVGLVRAGASLPFASVALEPPWSLLAGVVAAVTVLSAAIRRRRPLPPAKDPFAAARRRPGERAPLPALLRIAGVALAGSVVAVALVAMHRPDGSTRIVALDVGQGDAILVEGSRGSRMLVDTGPDPDRLLVELDERLPPWDHRIDLVVITHPHEDHIAGLALLLQRYQVGRVLEPGMRGPGPGYSAAADAITTNNVPHGLLATGDRLSVDDLDLRVLWPDPGHVPREPGATGVAINNVSIVLLGEVGGRRILLTGDAEQDVDPQLVARGLPRVDLLKVAHHGSATATTDALLDAIQPRLALISVGAGNTYGHPARSTLARLQAHGTQVLRTDEDGTIEVAVGASGLSAHSAAGTVLASIPTSPRAGLAKASGDHAGWGALDGAGDPPGGPGRWARAPSGLLYHRPDVHPRARGRRLPPSRPGSAGLVPPSRAGRRRDRRLARRPLRGSRCRGGSEDRRGGGAAPRC